MFASLIETSPIRRFIPLRCRSTAVLIAACFVSTGLSMATAADPIAMQLLSREAGWISQGGKLYWTENRGSTWRDITPVFSEIGGQSSRLKNLYFHNPVEGWAILATPAPASNDAKILTEPKATYILAHTLNSGQAWSLQKLSFPALPAWVEDSLVGPASLFFVDSQHGWIDFALAGNAKPGKLLATADGGHTWRWVNSPGLSGPMVFTSARDGWMVGYFGDEKLYATHDGCHTWQEITLPGSGPTIAPVQLSTAAGPEYSRAFYVVRHDVASHGLSVHSTKDQGSSWHLVKTISIPPQSSSSEIPLAIAGAQIIFPTGSVVSEPAVTFIDLTSRKSSTIPVLNRGVKALSFADAESGWMLTADGRLLATRDRGVTWHDISPLRSGTSPTVQP